MFQSFSLSLPLLTPVSVSICFRKRRLSETLIYEHSKNIYRSYFVAMPFCQNHADWISPRSLAYLMPGCWPPQQCQEWSPSHGLGCKSNQILVCYYQKLCALIVPMYDAGRSSVKTKGFVAGLQVYFCPLIACRVPSCTMNSRGEGSSSAPAQSLHVQ